MYEVAITNIQSAFKEIKHFSPDDWDGDYRIAAREVIKRILEDRMKRYRDAYLDDAVISYHKRPLSDRYKVLIIDGVVMKQKTKSRVAEEDSFSGIRY